MDGLRLYLSDRHSYLALLRAGAAFTNAPDAGKKIELAEHGFFSGEIFEWMISGGKSYNTGPGKYIWSRLAESGIIFEALGFGMLALVSCKIVDEVLDGFIKSETFENIFYPPSAMVDRYSGAVVAIDVEKHGVEYRGTGFVVRDSTGGSDLLVTALHNVDDKDGVVIKSIKTASGNALEVKRFRKNTKLDLACAELVLNIEPPAFSFSRRTELLTELITIGFPRIPRSASVLIAHRGELNGFTEPYFDEPSQMIISNIVSPGSSGCPILSRFGFCAGMTTRWLEAEYGEQKVRFSAGLPSDEIIAFANSI